MQETSSLQCLDAIVLVSFHQKTPLCPLQEPIKTVAVLWPVSNAPTQVASTSTGPGPPSPSTEMANPDENTSTTSDLQDAAIESYISDPNFQCGVQELGRNS